MQIQRNSRRQSPSSRITSASLSTARFNILLFRIQMIRPPLCSIVVHGDSEVGLEFESLYPVSLHYYGPSSPVRHDQNLATHSEEESSTKGVLEFQREGTKGGQLGGTQAPFDC